MSPWPALRSLLRLQPLQQLRPPRAVRAAAQQLHQLQHRRELRVRRFVSARQRVIHKGRAMSHTVPHAVRRTTIASVGAAGVGCAAGG
jgi:hypothetical protein